MRILTLEQMLAAAEDTNLPGYSTLLAQIEREATQLSVQLAAHLGVKASVQGATYERYACGICACFFPENENSVCPEILEKMDPGGDWLLLGETHASQ